MQRRHRDPGVLQSRPDVRDVEQGPGAGRPVHVVAQPAGHLLADKDELSVGHAGPHERKHLVEQLAGRVLIGLVVVGRRHHHRGALGSWPAAGEVVGVDAVGHDRHAGTGP